MRKWRFRSGADAKSRTPVMGVIFLQQLSLGVRAGSSTAAMGYRTVRTVFRVNDGFSDWCCANTTLTVFHVGIQDRARIRPPAEGTLASAHGFRGTAWAKPCFCSHAEPRS